MRTAEKRRKSVPASTDAMADTVAVAEPQNAPEPTQRAVEAQPDDPSVVSSEVESPRAIDGTEPRMEPLATAAEEVAAPTAAVNASTENARPSPPRARGLAAILQSRDSGNRQRYLALLGDFESRDTAQVDELHGLCKALGISAEQAQKDWDIVRTAKRLRDVLNSDYSRDLREEREAAEKAEQAHTEVYQRFHGKWREEHVPLAMASANARARQTQSEEAKREAWRQMDELSRTHADLLVGL